MKKIVLGIGLVMMLLGNQVWAQGETESLRLYDVAAQKEMGIREALPSLLKKRLIIVGEHHNNEVHHEIAGTSPAAATRRSTSCRVFSWFSTTSPSVLRCFGATVRAPLTVGSAAHSPKMTL